MVAQRNRESSIIKLEMIIQLRFNTLKHPRHTHARVHAHATAHSPNPQP